MRFTKAFTVPSISATDRGAISWIGNLFKATKFESKKQSEEPESTKPSKIDETSGERRAVCEDFKAIADAAPRCRVGSPVSFMQLILGGGERTADSFFLVFRLNKGILKIRSTGFNGSRGSM